MFTGLLHRWRALVRRSAVERDLDEELQFHLDQQVAAYEKAGLDRAEALRRARLEFGGVDQIREEYRDSLGVRTIDTLRRDLRLAVRALRAAPVVSIVAVLSLTLGIGANTAIFSLVNGLVLRTLPVRDPNRLVLVSDTTDHARAWSYKIWLEIQRRHLFDDAAAWSATRFNLRSGGGETQFVDGLWISGSFFRALGVARSGVVDAVQAAADRQQLKLRPTGYEAFAVVEHIADLGGLRRHRGNPDLRPAVQVQRADLGDRHLEPPQRRDDRSHVPTLVLERSSVAGQPDVEQGGAGEQGSDLLERGPAGIPAEPLPTTLNYAASPASRTCRSRRRSGCRCSYPG